MTTTQYNVCKSIITCFLVISSVLVSAQNARSTYDKNLADSLQGDDYGMKRYVLVILKTGTATITDKSVTDSLFKGHMKNINRLADSGKLVVAGPLTKNDKTYRGIFILNASTIEEAKVLLDTDPAVKANIFDYELYQWYGSAALPMYLQYHERVEKKKF